MKGETGTPRTHELYPAKNIDSLEAAQLPQSLEECQEATENAFIEASLALNEDIDEKGESLLTDTEALERMFFEDPSAALYRELIELIDAPDTPATRQRAERLLAATTPAALRIGSHVHTLVTLGFGTNRTEVAAKLSSGAVGTIAHADDEALTAFQPHRLTLIGLLRRLGKRYEHPAWQIEIPLELPSTVIMRDPFGAGSEVVWKKFQTDRIETGKPAPSSIYEMSGMVTDRLLFHLETLTANATNPELQEAAETLATYLEKKRVKYIRPTPADFANTHLGQEPPNIFLAIFHALNTIKYHDPELFLEILGIDTMQAEEARPGRFFGSYLHHALAGTQRRIENFGTKTLSLTHLMTSTLDMRQVPTRFAGIVSQATLHAAAENIKARAPTQTSAGMLADMSAFMMLAMDNEIRQQLEELQEKDLIKICSDYDRLEADLPHGGSPVKFLRFIGEIPKEVLLSDQMRERLQTTFPYINGAHTDFEIQYLILGIRDLDSVSAREALEILYRKVPAYHIHADYVPGELVSRPTITYPRAEACKRDLEAVVGFTGSVFEGEGRAIAEAALTAKIAGSSFFIFPTKTLQDTLFAKARPRDTTRSRKPLRRLNFADIEITDLLPAIRKEHPLRPEMYLALADMLKTHTGINHRFDDTRDTLSAIKRSHDIFELISIMIAQGHAETVVGHIFTNDKLLLDADFERSLENDNPLIQALGQACFTAINRHGINDAHYGIKPEDNIASTDAHLSVLYNAWKATHNQIGLIPNGKARLRLIKKAADALGYRYRESSPFNEPLRSSDCVIATKEAPIIILDIRGILARLGWRSRDLEDFFIDPKDVETIQAAWENIEGKNKAETATRMAGIIRQSAQTSVGKDPSRQELEEQILYFFQKEIERTSKRKRR